MFFITLSSIKLKKNKGISRIAELSKRNRTELTVILNAFKNIFLYIPPLYKLVVSS